MAAEHKDCAHSSGSSRHYRKLHQAYREHDEKIVRDVHALIIRIRVQAKPDAKPDGPRYFREEDPSEQK